MLIGGPLTDQGFSIDLDASGNVYTTGLFSATCDFDPSVGTFYMTSNGSGDIYVHKMGQSSVGVSENKLSQLKIVFPNPSAGTFYFSLLEEEMSIEIYDVVGQLILKTAFENKSTVLDLSNYNNGIYFYKIIGEKSYSGKLIKQ